MMKSIVEQIEPITSRPRAGRHRRPGLAQRFVAVVMRIGWGIRRRESARKRSDLHHPVLEGATDREIVAFVNRSRDQHHLPRARYYRVRNS